MKKVTIHRHLPPFSLCLLSRSVRRKVQSNPFNTTNSIILVQTSIFNHPFNWSMPISGSILTFLAGTEHFQEATSIHQNLSKSGVKLWFTDSSSVDGDVRLSTVQTTTYCHASRTNACAGIMAFPAKQQDESAG
jgi:hypothetical protein